MSHRQQLAAKRIFTDPRRGCDEEFTELDDDTDESEWTDGDEIQASAIAENNSRQIPGNY